MNLTSAQTFTLDWDLDLDDAFDSDFEEVYIHQLNRSEAFNRSTIFDTLMKPDLSDVPFYSLPEASDILVFLDDDDDDEIIPDVDNEDLVQESHPDVSLDARRSVLLRIEQLALSFLEKIGTDKIELTLVNRMKTRDDGSPTTRVLCWPKKTKNCGFRIFACLFRVVDLIHEALTTNIPTTKRDIFYKDVSLFKTQSVVDNLVDDLAATLNVSRGDLNVRASSKGLFCGSGLSIHLKRGGIVQGNNSEGALIPAGTDISDLQVSEAVSWVLIIEKEAVFQTLCRVGLTSCPCCPGPGIIITGKGYPDLATRELVSRLSATLPTSVPLLALVDADAYGLDILSVYKFGSQRLSHEGYKMTAPRIIWLGMWVSELCSLGVDRDDLIPLTRHDHKKAVEMLRRSGTVMPIQWRNEISRMLHNRGKAEIEIVSSALKLVSQPNGSQHTILRQFQDDALATDRPPLVQYLIPKLNFWVKRI